MNPRGFIPLYNTKGLRYIPTARHVHGWRPVPVTVGATVLALFPVALHGGPLWQPLCYAQIGGLLIATFITLLLVPVLYAVAVLDLKVVRWETQGERMTQDSAGQLAAPAGHRGITRQTARPCMPDGRLLCG